MTLQQEQNRFNYYVDMLQKDIKYITFCSTYMGYDYEINDTMDTQIKLFLESI